MHGFTRALEKRLRALEQRFGAIPSPETPSETNRRFELCRAALAGEIPGDLGDGERPVFSKILRYAPIARELLDEGLVGDDGRPGGGDDPRHEDGDGFEASAWQP